MLYDQIIIRNISNLLICAPIIKHSVSLLFYPTPFKLYVIQL